MGGVGGAAAVYVPLMLVNRALALVRVVVVGNILGMVGKGEFSRYQLGLELVNWIVPLIMLGLADTAERYVAHYERMGEARQFLRRHFGRLVVMGGGTLVVFVAASPWLGAGLFPGAVGSRLLGLPAGADAAALVIVAAVVIWTLAIFQYMLAALRGLRAYAAAAAMETASALLLLILSALAAWRGGAVELLLGYWISLALPAAYYGVRLRGYLRGMEAAAGAEISGEAGNLKVEPRTDETPPRLRSFARWSQARLMLMMTFGFVGIYGVGWLARRQLEPNADAHAADYTMAYRVAQTLAYAGAVLWASAYGVAAKAWSHGARRRARMMFLAVGRIGGVGLLMAACCVLGLRDLLLALLPAYEVAIVQLLPALLGIFLWYAMLGFLVAYGDLQERPWVGAVLWAVAAGVQAGVIFGPAWCGVKLGGMDAPWTVVVASGLGLGMATMVCAPAFLWRPVRLTSVAAPIGILLVSMGAFFWPGQLVEAVASGAIVIGVGSMWLGGLLIRRREMRAMEKWYARRERLRRTP